MAAMMAFKIPSGELYRQQCRRRLLAVLSQQVVQLTGKGHREPGRHS